MQGATPPQINNNNFFFSIIFPSYFYLVVLVMGQGLPNEYDVINGLTI